MAPSKAKGSTKSSLGVPTKRVKSKVVYASFDEI